MWENLLSQNRYDNNGKIILDSSDKNHRNSFHKDYDRLIFSNSFRRLSKKTQVHPLSNNDHVHNRLTHSLEVASVGRSLGLQASEIINRKYDLKINPYDVAYIIQTACLAHDIGNPPFGHAGEEVIKEWFCKNEKEIFLRSLSEGEINDFKHIDGNAQSFRVVSALENHFLSGGMQLTFATLGTLVKYPYSSDKCKLLEKSKFNYFKSEEESFKKIFEHLGLNKKDGGYKRHPLSYLMEASDDICYGLLDLQDAIELKIINLSDTKDIFINICGEEYVNLIESEPLSDVGKISNLVSESINLLAIHVMEIFEENIDLILNEQQPKDLISLFSKVGLKEGIDQAKQLGVDKIFNDKRKIELELGSYNIIKTLLDNFIRAVYAKFKNEQSFRDKRVLALMGDNAPDSSDLYTMYQRVLDYVVGMTDNHAKHIACQINGVG